MLCSYPGQWSSVWHIFAACQALKINIKQVYPYVSSHFEETTGNRRTMLRFYNSTFCHKERQGYFLDIMFS